MKRRIQYELRVATPSTPIPRVAIGSSELWGGVYGTHFWVDPKEKLSMVVLTNTAIAGMIGEFPSQLQKAAYA
jgi:CubicO group peptidase (beta-lactamase class C family)